MAVVYSTTVKNARLQAVIDALGAGALLVLGTSALSGATGVLASVPLANPSFTVSGGVMTLASTPRTVAASANGTVAKAELRTSGGTVIASGLTVGLSASDIIVNATAFSIGQTVQVTTGTITHG
jgi:hypothetical protein